MIKVEAKNPKLERKGATVPLRILRNCVAHSNTTITETRVTLQNKTDTELVYRASMERKACDQWLARIHERVWNLVFGNAPVDDEVFVFEKLSKSELDNMCKDHKKTQAWKDKMKELGTTLKGRDQKKAFQKANAELRQSLEAKWKRDRIDVVAKRMLGEVRKELSGRAKRGELAKCTVGS